MIAENTPVTIGLVVIIFGALAGLWFRLEARFRDVDSARQALERDLAAFELKVAEHYASDDRLEQMETKFTSAIDKLINRFDAFATDFHRIVGRIEAGHDERPAR